VLLSLSCACGKEIFIQFIRLFSIVKLLFENWRKYGKEVLSESRQLGETISKEITNELLKKVKRLLTDGIPIAGHHAERGFVDIVLTREEFLETKKSHTTPHRPTGDLRGTEAGRSAAATNVRKDIHKQFKDLRDIRLRVIMASDDALGGRPFQFTNASQAAPGMHAASGHAHVTPWQPSQAKAAALQPFAKPGNVEVFLTVNEQVFGRWEEAPEKRPEARSGLAQEAQRESGKASHRKFRTKMVNIIMSKREGISYGAGKRFYKPGVHSGFRHTLRKIVHHEIIHIRQMMKGWFVTDPKTGVKPGHVGPMRHAYPLTMAEFDAFMRERISYARRMIEQGMKISFLDHGSRVGLYTSWVNKMADFELDKIQAAEAKIRKLGPNPHPKPGPFPDEGVYERWYEEEVKRRSPRPVHPQALEKTLRRNYSSIRIKSDFNMPWHESLMPIGPNYLAVERSVLECAYAGCNTIWIVCNDDVTPLIRYQVGEMIQDPVYNYRHFEHNKKEFKRPIRIYYVPIKIRDINKRDNLAWSAIHGAKIANKILRKISLHLAPDKFWISWPYGYYRPDIVRDVRKEISSGQRHVVL
jgi:hypothetical protein